MGGARADTAGVTEGDGCRHGVCGDFASVWGGEWYGRDTEEVRSGEDGVGEALGGYG